MLWGEFLEKGDSEQGNSRYPVDLEENNQAQPRVNHGSWGCGLGELPSGRHQGWNLPDLRESYGGGHFGAVLPGPCPT